MKDEAKLTIKISTKKSMSLEEMAIYLDALSKEHDLTRKNELQLSKKSGRLEVVNLRKGSWIIELIGNADVILSFLIKVLALVKIWKGLNGKEKDKKDPEKKDPPDDNNLRLRIAEEIAKSKHLRLHKTGNIERILRIAVRQRSRFEFKINIKGKISIVYISHDECKVALDNIKEEKKKVPKKVSEVSFRWAIASFSESSNLDK